ncbi:MAG: anti-anti-sigma regulatory factor [Enterobacterales bacterium]|jgi:anti-anti-sigma regulatory factor
MSKKCTLSLPERLDISEAVSLKERMDKALDKDSTVLDVKADKVGRVDSAGVQLLLSFKAAAIEAGKEVNLSNPTDEFLAAVELLGAMELLEL